MKTFEKRLLYPNNSCDKETTKKKKTTKHLKAILLIFAFAAFILLTSCLFPGPGRRDHGRVGGNHEHHMNNGHQGNNEHRR
ncbi:MAG: hypothetical protein WCH34_16110 [Bacteroidota bacterium]